MILLDVNILVHIHREDADRHAELKREITALEAKLEQDDAAARQYEKYIAALGGQNMLNRIVEQTQIRQARLHPLEFFNGPRERKLAAIETELAELKPASEAFKAAQTK